MERLTRRNEKGIAVLNIRCPEWCEHATCSSEEGYQCQHQCEGDIIDKLAIYEDAEEQGLHLRLPISKDTPVYSIEYCCGRNKNNRIGMCVRGFCKDCDDKAYYIREDTAEHCSICEIQKSVFFTCEEAEAKLKEMEGSHDRE